MSQEDLWRVSKALETCSYIGADVRVQAIEVQAGFRVQSTLHTGLRTAVTTVEVAKLVVQPGIANSVTPLYHRRPAVLLRGGCFLKAPFDLVRRRGL